MGVPYEIVNAADYGVPQLRKRVFAGEGWTLTPTHDKTNYLGVLDALPDLLGELHPPESMKTRWANLNADSPFPTITSASTRQIRIKEPCERIRSFTVAESAALQGYANMKIPEGMKKKAQWTIVGNMVCPPVAYAIIKGLNQ